MSVIVKTKILNSKAVSPESKTNGAAAFDLTATSVRLDRANNATIFGIGLAFEIPKGYAMFIYPRSSSFKYNADFTNSVGVIDSDYRGEVHVMFKGLNVGYNLGDRIAQAIVMPIPEVQYVQAESLSETERGDGGFGSTGNK